jgi:DNA polymerase elongation subunit (family B)
MSKPKSPKILFYDIETSPNLGYVWQKWETDVIQFHTEWEILSFAYKFQGDKSVKCVTRKDFLDKTDKSLVKKLQEVMDSADIIVAHNGDQFDIKKSTARMIFHGLGPTKIIKSIDTKKIAKKYFAFNSNSLNDLGEYLGLGKKVKTGGFELWLGCMSGDKRSWN